MSRLSNVLCAGILILSAAPSRAWWFFGKSQANPELTGGTVAQVDITSADKPDDVYRNQLEGGHLTAKFFFRPGRGAQVAQASVSLDGGKTWDNKVELSKDSFLYTFKPVANQDYDVRAKILDDAGKESAPGDVPAFKFTYRDQRAEAVAEQDLQSLVQAYLSRSIGRFDSLVSSAYLGDRGSFIQAVNNDFQAFSNVKMELIPTRTVLNGRDATIDVRFNETRTLSSTALQPQQPSTVNLQPSRSSATTVKLRLEGKHFKLLQTTPAALFGLSSSAGEVVDLQGGSSIPQSAATCAGLPVKNAQIGEFKPAAGSAFDFLHEQNTSRCAGHVWFDPTPGPPGDPTRFFRFVPSPGAGILPVPQAGGTLNVVVPTGSFIKARSCDPGGGGDGVRFDPNMTYAVEFASGQVDGSGNEINYYAVFRAASPPGDPITINYKVCKTGGRAFH